MPPKIEKKKKKVVKRKEVYYLIDLDECDIVEFKSLEIVRKAILNAYVSEGSGEKDLKKMIEENQLKLFTGEIAIDVESQIAKISFEKI